MKIEKIYNFAEICEVLERKINSPKNDRLKTHMINEFCLSYGNINVYSCKRVDIDVIDVAEDEKNLSIVFVLLFEYEEDGKIDTGTIFVPINDIAQCLGYEKSFISMRDKKIYLQP